MNSARPIPTRYAIGIDVGGTKIAGGIVDLTTGKLTERQQIPTDYHRGGDAILVDVAAMASDLLAPGPHPGALGIAVAELVDPVGRVFSDYRIGWKGVDVASQSSPVLPTVVSSDVRAAALAEARFGAGRGLTDFYFVTIGTGISGVLVQNGTPYAGSRGAALVIANGVTQHHCPACGHVTAQVVEDIANGPGLAAAYGQAAETLLADANAGNPRAIDLIDHATQELGRVLALLAGALDPQAIIIGGGLGSAPGVYFDKLTQTIRAGLWQDQGLQITQAALGRDAGIIGAALATQTKLLTSQGEIT
jgi:glucokinase